MGSPPSGEGCYIERPELINHPPLASPIKEGVIVLLRHSTHQRSPRAPSPWKRGRGVEVSLTNQVCLLYIDFAIYNTMRTLNFIGVFIKHAEINKSDGSYAACYRASRCGEGECHKSACFTIYWS